MFNNVIFKKLHIDLLHVYLHIYAALLICWWSPYTGKTAIRWVSSKDIHETFSYHFTILQKALVFYGTSVVLLHLFSFSSKTEWLDLIFFISMKSLWEESKDLGTLLGAGKDLQYDPVYQLYPIYFSYFCLSHLYWQQDTYDIHCPFLCVSTKLTQLDF